MLSWVNSGMLSIAYLCISVVDTESRKMVPTCCCFGSTNTWGAINLQRQNPRGCWGVVFPILSASMFVAGPSAHVYVNLYHHMPCRSVGGISGSHDTAVF